VKPLTRHERVYMQVLQAEMLELKAREIVIREHLQTLTLRALVTKKFVRLPDVLIVHERLAS
jgi:hypothetical protein